MACVLRRCSPLLATGCQVDGEQPAQRQAQEVEGSGAATLPAAGRVAGRQHSQGGRLKEPVKRAYPELHDGAAEQLRGGKGGHICPSSRGRGCLKARGGARR